MRRYAQISLMLVTLVACLPPGGDLWAKNGRGGSKGGGGNSHKAGSSFHGHGGSGKSVAGLTHRGSAKPSSAAKHGETKHTRNEGDQPWTKHYAREERKLEHRKQVAEHLREVSDRNGNEHLKQVADDMDQRAQAHYDKQMEKINRKYGLDGPADGVDAPENIADNPVGGADDSLDDSGEFFDGTSDRLEEAGRKLTGTENAAARQLRNEVRKLGKRMESVEKMRAMAEETGDESMLQAADRLEQQALDHFHQRMEKITEFRQRHGLPDVFPHVAP
jgi:hypothetical protein